VTRRRYVQIDGVLHEVDLNYVPEPRRHDGVLYNDRAYQDMGDPRFNSRSSHREYMKRNNVTTMDDFKTSWSKAAQQREQIRQGVDSTRRREVERAVHENLNRRR
jgi:hypothetical protein